MKGQTAVEYLMTYGWAILIILIVTGVLVYYDIFYPENFFLYQEIDFIENPSIQNITKCFKLDETTIQCQKLECMKLSYNNTFCRFLENVFYNIKE